MNSLYRLYYSPDCPQCRLLKDKLSGTKLPIQFIDITNDAVILAGIEKLFKQLEVPVFIDFHTRTIVRGNKEVEIDKCISAYNSFISSKSSD